MNNFKHLDKNKVIEYYQTHTLNECAEKFDCCSETIKRKLMLWGIKVRTKKEALKMAFGGDSKKSKLYRKVRSERAKKKYKKLGQKMFSQEFRNHIGKIKELNLNTKGKNNGNWKGGDSIHWLRFKTINRAKGKCEVCNWNELSEILEVHHIDQNRKNNKLNNGLAVCPLCHRKIHYHNLRNKKEIFNKLISK